MRWTPSLPPMMITGHSILEAVYFSYKKHTGWAKKLYIFQHFPNSSLFVLFGTVHF